MQFELWYTPDRWLQTFHIYVQHYNNPDTQKTTILYLITYKYVIINYNAYFIDILCL